MRNVGVEQHLYCLTSTVLSLNENNSCEFGVVKPSFVFNVRCWIAVNGKVSPLKSIRLCSWASKTGLSQHAGGMHGVTGLMLYRTVSGDRKWCVITGLRSSVYITRYDFTDVSGVVPVYTS